MSFHYDKKEYPPENNTEKEKNKEEKREDQLIEEEAEETTEQFHKRNWAFPNEQEFSQDMECKSKGLKCQLNTDLDSHKKICKICKVTKLSVSILEADSVHLCHLQCADARSVEDRMC